MGQDSAVERGMAWKIDMDGGEDSARKTLMCREEAGLAQRAFVQSFIQPFIQSVQALLGHKSFSGFFSGSRDTFWGIPACSQLQFCIEAPLSHQHL